MEQCEPPAREATGAQGLTGEGAAVKLRWAPAGEASTVLAGYSWSSAGETGR